MTADITPVAPGDISWFAWDFTNVLSGTAGVVGTIDVLTGNPIISFDPPGPSAANISILGNKVVALISGVKYPGNNAACSVITTLGQRLTRSFYIPCEAFV